MGEVFPFAVLLSLSCRYYSSCVAKRTASLGPVGLLMFVLPLYSFLLCIAWRPAPPTATPSLKLRRWMTSATSPVMKTRLHQITIK